VSTPRANPLKDHESAHCAGRMPTAPPCQFRTASDASCPQLQYLAGSAQPHCLVRTAPATGHKSAAILRDTSRHRGRQRLTPAAPTLATSSCASSSERPVRSDCADATGNPAASSSVRVALNTPSMLPKNSTSRLPRVGPRPGVRINASHEV
jgi:hypothetical protein